MSPGLRKGIKSPKFSALLVLGVAPVKISQISPSFTHAQEFGIVKGASLRFKGVISLHFVSSFSKFLRFSFILSL